MTFLLPKPREERKRVSSLIDFLITLLLLTLWVTWKVLQRAPPQELKTIQTKRSTRFPFSWNLFNNGDMPHYADLQSEKLYPWMHARVCVCVSDRALVCLSWFTPLHPKMSPFFPTTLALSRVWWIGLSGECATASLTRSGCEMCFTWLMSTIN